jgi:hypothetical protein
MSKSESDGRNQPLRKAASNSFGHLIQRALAGSSDTKKAYDQLRTTYLKDEYKKVFRPWMLRIERRPVGVIDSRKRDFRFTVNQDSICFVRNLWFAHQFFSKPSEVVRFLKTANTTKERRKMVEERFDELESQAQTYGHWSQSAPQISKRLETFDPTKTDLLTVSESAASNAQSKETSISISGSPAVADFIREVEQSDSYRAGNPDAACEKALYFLALSRPDIAQRIADEVLAENPDHAVALYANAVLLIEAGERHRQQAFIHDIMHPHDLPPLEAEEFHHVERHVEESLQAQQKESQAFLLILKARRHWPKQFAIKCYDLSPSVWQHKVEEWLFRQAAARVGEDPKGLCLPSSAETGRALKLLKEVVLDIWAKGCKWMLNPLSSVFLRHFIIVAAHVDVKVARDCLEKLEAALEEPKLVENELELLWRDAGMVLPISPEPTLAETLIPAVRDSLFCSAIFVTRRPTGKASALLHRIAKAGMTDECDRRTAMRSLAAREVVLNIAHGGDFTHAVEFCREMTARRDWPSTATATGEKLQACWQYAVIVLLFESSRAAFEANDTQAAAEQAALALQHATESLESIAGEKPLVKFIESDEYDDREIVGDFLYRQPNVITDIGPSQFFRARGHGKWMSWPGHNACWDVFAKWSEGDCLPGTPLLLAYGYWLAQRHGQGDLLLPKCDALAERVRSLSKESKDTNPERPDKLER